jgi:hypothetical protein
MGVLPARWRVLAPGLGVPADGQWDSGISLPWIGPDYRHGGVVVLGINFNDANGLTRVFEIGAAEAEEMADGAAA